MYSTVNNGCPPWRPLLRSITITSTFPPPTHHPFVCHVNLFAYALFTHTLYPNPCSIPICRCMDAHPYAYILA